MRYIFKTVLPFIALISLGFGGALFAQAASAQSTQAPNKVELQDYVENLVQNEKLVSLALSTHKKLEDGTILSNYYVSGVQRADDSAPVSDNDLWHIGSCTKAMTALLYGDLIQKKGLPWGSSISDIFKNHVEFIDPAWSAVTMEDILAHRAGIEDFGATWMIKRIMDERDLKTQRLEAIAALLAVPPALPIGEFQYSNLGYILAGTAVEALTGESWEQAMKTGLPSQIMGAENWGFGPPQGAQPEGHRKAFFGKKLKPVGKAQFGADNPPVLGPAGTVHASHEAWANFALAFLPGQTQIDETLKTKILTPPEGEDYALGWGIYEDEDHGLVYSHSGSNTMWLAQVMVLPEKNLVILASTNTPPERAQSAIRKAVKVAADNLTEIELNE